METLRSMMVGRDTEIKRSIALGDAMQDKSENRGVPK